MIFLELAQFAFLCPPLINPIANAAQSLTEKQIKSHYKKLSVKFHPDKVKPGPNETLEELNDRFVEITKAYKALTDEEVRNNFIQYGHPDGKQSFSMGIALPKWIVEGSNMYFTLALYGLLFGIVLPYTVGKWWYGTRRRTKDGVMVESAGRLVKEYNDNNTIFNVIEILTSGEEMKQVVSGEHEKDWSSGEEATVEKRIAQAGLFETQIKSLAALDGWRRRALGLLWAYLYRVDLGNDKLENGMWGKIPSLCEANFFFFFSQTGCCRCCYCIEQVLSSYRHCFL